MEKIGISELEMKEKAHALSSTQYVKTSTVSKGVRKTSAVDVFIYLNASSQLVDIGF